MKVHLTWKGKSVNYEKFEAPFNQGAAISGTLYIRKELFKGPVPASLEIDLPV